MFLQLIYNGSSKFKSQPQPQNNLKEGFGKIKLKNNTQKRVSKTVVGAFCSCVYSDVCVKKK